MSLINLVSSHLVNVFQMKMRFDWKFWIVIIVTLAGVAIPVWLWQSDLSSRSLHLKQISQTLLQPPDAAKTLDLKISVAGTELLVPYLTVFELTNDGVKPVPSSDFESPIEISSTNDAVIIRSGTNSTNPKNLSPSIVVEDGVLGVKPLLLNPGDSITISVLTTGEKPKFSSRARIAGIQTVAITDIQSEPKLSIRIGIFLLILALLCLVASSLVIDGWPFKGVRLRPRASFFIFLTGTITGAISIAFGMEAFGVSGFMPFMGVILTGLVIGSVIAMWLNRAEIVPSPSLLDKNDSKGSDKDVNA